MPTLAETRRATRSRETFEWFDDLEEEAPRSVVDLSQAGASLTDGSPPAHEG